MYFENPLPLIFEELEKTQGNGWNPFSRKKKPQKVQKGLFADAEFPRSNESVKRDSEFERECFHKMPERWLRLYDRCDEPSLFRQGEKDAPLAKKAQDIDPRINPDDIKQGGGLGDCWFISVVSALAANPNVLRDIFSANLDAVDDDVERALVANRVGVYALKLFDKHSKQWGYILVDDYIPVMQHDIDNELCFARSRDRNEIWPQLIEKAFAKIHGSYQWMYGKHSKKLMYDDVLGMLTGGVVDYQKVGDDPDDTYNRIEKMLKDDVALMSGTYGCYTPGIDDPVKNGLSPNHAYSVLGVFTFSDGDRVIRFRNPVSR